MTETNEQDNPEDKAKNQLHIVVPSVACKVRTPKYKVHTLLQETKSICEVYRGIWLSTRKPIAPVNTSVIIKRFFDSVVADIEISQLQKLHQKAHRGQRFFARLLHIVHYPDKAIDLIFEDGGDDVYNHFATLYPFVTYTCLEFTMRVRRVSFVLSRLVECVLQLHLLGLVHNDIKPENFVVDERDGIFRLIDFGMCSDNMLLTSNHNDFFAHRNGAGSEFFIHPSLWRKEPILLYHNDWWAVGQTAFILYTNLTPYNATASLDEETRIKNREFASDVFLTSNRWSIDLPPELKSHDSYNKFVSFVTRMCCILQRPSYPDFLLLQDPFLCYWTTPFIQ